MRDHDRTERAAHPSMTKEGLVEFIFVYGTLRNKAKAAERNLLAKYGVRVGIGQVPSASLFLGKYPYAVPDKGAGHPLVGEVYRLLPDTVQEVLAKLDAYEEYDPSNVKDSLYRREVVNVQVGKDQLRAWIYWYNKPLRDVLRLRHGNYLKTQMHVVPSGSNWKVKVAGATKATATHTNKAEAVRYARAVAGKKHMMLVIHGRDGRIKERIRAEKG